ncbi:helix-turn-helix domain-containing protein [Mycolicibacterium sp. Y3]
MTALDVLEGVARNQPVGLSALARKLNLPKTTVHRCLATLAAAGWVEAASDAHAQWMLTSRVFTVAFAAANRVDLANNVVPHLHRLAREVRASARARIRDGDELIVIEHAGVGGYTESLAVGTRDLLHVGGAEGTVILAYAPPDELDEYVKRHHLGTADRHEYANIRSRGFAVDTQDQGSVTTFAAAIRFGPGWPLGTVSAQIPGAVDAAAVRDKLGAIVAATAGDIAADLAASSGNVSSP